MKHPKEVNYLGVNIVSPESCLCSLVRIRRQQGRLFIPNLVNVLDSNQRLTNGFAIVDENWYFLMNWVHLEE